MGLNNHRMVYIDSCIMIYYVEHHENYYRRVISCIENTVSGEFFISPLVEMECLVIPIRHHNHPLIDLYNNAFQQFKILKMHPEVFHFAAKLRAQYPNLKTPDALHLATANYHGCTEFWTNDDRLGTVMPGMLVNILADIHIVE